VGGGIGESMSERGVTTVQSEKDRRTIESYLAGSEPEFRLVDGWVMHEIDLRYRSLRAEREDLGQRVHEKLVANLRAGEFRSESTFRTYLVSVVHHTCIDALRRRFLRETEELSEDAPASWGNPYRAVQAREARQILHQVLRRSPEMCRTLWRLIFLEKLHYREIGARLGIPSGTVKSRMHACRQKALAILRALERVAGT